MCTAESGYQPKYNLHMVDYITDVWSAAVWKYGIHRRNTENLIKL